MATVIKGTRIKLIDNRNLTLEIGVEGEVLEDYIIPDEPIDVMDLLLVRLDGDQLPCELPRTFCEIIPN